MFTPCLDPLSRHFSTLTEHEYLAMIFPFPVPYLSLPWRFSFCSVLACQRNQCNFRSLASLLILVFWRSFQSTAYVHEYTRVLKAPIYSCYFASATGSSSISMSQQLTLSLLLSYKLSSELYTNSSTLQSERNFSPFALPPVSLLSQQLNKIPRLKTCRANTSNYRTYVDSYNKLKAKLFPAYLQTGIGLSVYFNIRNTFSKPGTFLLGNPV